MFIEIIGRMLDNGFSLSRAIQDERRLRRERLIYTKRVQDFVHKMGHQYGLQIQEFEVYGEEGLSICLYQAEKAISLTSFKTNTVEPKPEMEKLNAHLPINEINDWTILILNTRYRDLDTHKIKLFDSKEQLIAVLTSHEAQDLMKKYHFSPQMTLKKIEEALATFK